MSDRSYFQVLIYNRPKRSVQRRILKLFEENGFAPELSPDEADGGRVLLLGEPYISYEEVLDTYETIGETLASFSDRLVFKCWNDPKYEWMGGLYMHAPGLGSWTGDCDSNGSPVISAYDYLSLAAKVQEVPDGPSLAEELEQALGLKWLEAIDEARKELS